jgi:hypothetical protein
LKRSTRRASGDTKVSRTLIPSISSWSRRREKRRAELRVELLQEARGLATITRAALEARRSTPSRNSSKSRRGKRRPKKRKFRRSAKL